MVAPCGPFKACRLYIFMTTIYEGYHPLGRRGELSKLRPPTMEFTTLPT